MFEQYLKDQNFLALAAAALAYWMIGAIWFMPLFGKAWVAESEKAGPMPERPDTKTMMGYMIAQFIYGLLICFALSYIVFNTGSIMLPAAIKMGALLGACISFATLGSAYTWSTKSTKLLIIDGGYHIAASVVACIILSQWR